jgi:hypothetical protein
MINVEIQINVIMCCNNNFSGKYWVVFSTKPSRPHGDPGYQGLDYRRTTVIKYISDLTNSASPNKWLNIFLGFWEKGVNI